MSIKIALLFHKLRAFLMGGLCLLVSLHWEGSAPDVCTAGLFVAAASVVLKAVVS